MRFYPVSQDALLVELANLDETLALFDSLQQQPIHGVEELVPAARTVLVHFRPGAVSREALAAQIATRDVHGKARAAGKLIEIPVHYNGEDLDDVSGELGISRGEVIRRPAGSDYNVAVCAFAPGYPYLRPDPE
ncbi:carboxyltransferase domain-containing protein, partial [Pseudomonas viridiflava]|uniref:carboxyltransferase domain-containing protein n=1 Tax=Pseudomonas viridiflava TaxID=33069 RepID=UPI000F0975A6